MVHLKSIKWLGSQEMLTSSSKSIFMEGRQKLPCLVASGIFLEWNVHAIDSRNVVDIRIGPKRKYRRISQDDQQSQAISIQNPMASSINSVNTVLLGHQWPNC